MPDYVIRSDFSEAQVEADVAAYLAWCCASGPFHLIEADEQATGADWQWTQITPIYIQFKKSTGLKPFPTGLFKPRKNASRLQSIRAFRQARSLPDDPTLFFQLREQAKTAVDLQHNVLLAHHRPPFSYAIYVAPLHLRHDAYTRDLAAGPRGLLDPWLWSGAVLTSSMGATWWASRFQSQPFLRSHISITPHERVPDHNHYYAYSTGGSHVSWHSPGELEDAPRRLSDFMAARVRQMLEPDRPPSSAEDVTRFLAEIEKSIGFGGLGVGPDSPPVERLRAYGRWLRVSYGIVQLLMVRLKEGVEHSRP